MARMYWHATIASVGRTRLFGTVTQLRAAVRALAATAGPRLLLFCVADEHIHKVLEASATERGTVLSAVSRRLARLDGSGPLQRAWSRPVEERSHLASLVEYLAKQPSHHRLGTSDLLWDGSCVPDLLGARVLPGYDRRALRAALPRWRATDLLRALGIHRVDSQDGPGSSPSGAGVGCPPR